MKQVQKVAAIVMSAMLLIVGTAGTARAAQTPASVTAGQLLEAVSTQAAAVNSVHTAMTETFTMKDAATGQTVTAVLTSDIIQNRAVGHSVSRTKISTKGYSKTETAESYTAILENVLYTYQRNPKEAQWSFTTAALTKEQLAGRTVPLSISGIEAAGAAVTTDGEKFTLTSAITAEKMQELTGVLAASGVTGSGSAFPVVLEVDAATLLPVKMTVLMNGLVMPDMPSVTTDVTAVTTFDGFNQYDTFAVPAEVLEKAVQK